MSTENWKLEKDLCRCCHAEGCFKDLGGLTFNHGAEEVYSDMLRDCLDITLTPVDGELCKVTYTICEECIRRLRDASHFKKQVLVCEERFRDMYSRNIIKVLKPEFGADVKEEVTDTYPEAASALNQHDTIVPFFKEEYTHVDDDNNDFDLKFGDEDDEKTNLNVDINLENAKKSRRKGKSKSKSSNKERKGCKKVGRPRKKMKEEVATETADGEEVEGKRKKGTYLLPEHLQYFSTIEDGCAKKYICLKCGTVLTNVYTMKQHVTVLHLNKQIKCPLCDEQFKNISKKKRHLLRVHAMEEVGRGYAKGLRAISKCICDICHREFSNRLYLQDHMNYMHTFIKCPDCLDNFTNKELPLHRHQVHGASIPTCGVCGYKNRSEYRIALHQRKVHLKEKNVSCEHCNLMFFDKMGLKKHLVKHRSERKFECSFCHKKFQRKSTLQLHEKIHTGEKNKVCPLCSDRFVQKASLNYHMARHHPGAC